MAVPKGGKQVQLRGLLLAEVLELVVLANSSWLDSLPEHLVPASRRAEWKTLGRRISLTPAEQAVLMDQPNPFDAYMCDTLERAMQAGISAALGALLHIPYDYDVEIKHEGESVAAFLSLVMPLGHDRYAIQAGSWCVEDPLQFETLGEVVALMAQVTVAAAVALKRLQANLAYSGIQLHIGLLPVRRADSTDLKAGTLAILDRGEGGCYLIRVTDIDTNRFSAVVEEVWGRPSPTWTADTLGQYSVLDLERNTFAECWLPNIDF